MFYTRWVTRLSIIGVLVFSMLLAAPVFAVEKHTVEKRYEKGTITDVQEKTKTRVLYYVVNTPITKDEPYYEVSLQTKDTTYLARYTPRHAADTLDEDWQAGAQVDVRVEGRHLFLKRQSGTEMQFVILKHTAVKTGQTDSVPAPANK